MSPRHRDDQLPAEVLPPAHPAYVLRGHGAPVHSVFFGRHNSRLLTGDADGWVVLWNIATKRATAVWRAHEGALLGFGVWGAARFITHGRDGHLRVWQLRPEDEGSFSTMLPVDDPAADRKKPWLLHSLRVNTLNFCHFAMCRDPPASPFIPADAGTEDSILVAVPGTKDDEVNIFQLPSERRTTTVPNLEFKTGMVMAVSLFYASQTLHCISAYENGATAVHTFDASSNSWTRIYASQPHSQPILSLCPSPIPTASSNPQAITFFTSGADDLIAKHTVTLHPSQAPAPAPTPAPANAPPAPAAGRSLLSAALASQPSSAAPPPPPSAPAPVTPPAKELRTKHAGQQSLIVRSDGRILATAGWDARVRVYSAKSLKEVAVLKWHKDGCYAVAFADVDGPPEAEAVDKGGQEDQNTRSDAASGGEGGGAKSAETGGEGDGDAGALVRSSESQRQVGRTTVRSRREERAKTVHWLAAGAKDGKVSLWEVY